MIKPDAAPAGTGSGCRFIIIVLVVIVTLAAVVVMTGALSAPANMALMYLMCGTPDTESSEVLTLNPNAINAVSVDIRNLTNSPDSEFFPAWSPDGSRIAYLKGYQGSMGLYVMNADGSNPTQLTSNTELSTPSWSSDGKWIVYEDSGDLTNSRISLISADGSETLALTDGILKHSMPKWSPDGKQIMFIKSGTYSSQGFDKPDIYVVKINQASQDILPQMSMVAKTIQGGYYSTFTWSPDGKEIAFVSDESGQADIFLLQIGSTVVKQITNTTDREMDLSWSPDGSQILFLVQDSEMRSQLMLAKADGSDSPSLGSGIETAWSPDGARIAFADYGLIGVMNADGSGERILIQDPDAIYTRLSWSPDGSRLAFTRTHKGCNTP